MEKIRIKGGNTLAGEVNISAAKNSVLAIIVSCILCGDEIIIEEVPLLEDVRVLCDILKELNASVEINNITRQLKINTKNIEPGNTNNELIKKMRASFLIMGAMVGRFGYCKLSHPGGCNIGSRPIDLHLKGIKALGAEISVGYGYVEAKATELIGNRIYLDFPSVGATENIIMAAVFAKGTTIIENAAEEPEIWDLANFLNSMGAKIYGAGQGKITIEGVKELRPVVYRPIFDRIEAGTFMVSAAITKSEIFINGTNEEHLRPTIEKLKECGVIIEFIDGKMRVDGRRHLRPVDIKTLPHPGFPTDMQAQMMALLSLCKGSSVISETVFENRFMHAQELMRMGANIKIDGRTAIIEGVERLTGTEVKATDLRAGAAMILAGLVALGHTDITDIYHIDRGYVNIEEKFRNLGADIERIYY